ncbi:MAG TPA: NAD-dependent epimerase/dehydratase family protein [Gemmataceae bacterium]|jgi:dihydroflavonol-4-reductase|nr:NAD-dependent epimerase/dehydratase family protein [Gemmataceae bacterium]
MIPENADRSWRGRRVAITGATGFVGFHVARRLAAAGADVAALVRPSADRGRLVAAGVHCVEGSLEEPASLLQLARGREFLFHVAGAVDFGGDWQRLREVNVEGTRSVLAAARAAGVRRLVHTSSIVAVGATRSPRLLDETYAWNLGPMRVPYVTTKRQAEELALAANGKLEVVVVNPGCVVGPDDFAGSEFGTLCRRFWRGRLPICFGGGNNFVDVRDVAGGMLQAAERGRPGERYLLTGTNRSMTAFFGELARASGRTIPRLRLPTALAPVVAAFGEKFARRGPPALTAPQARVLPYFMYFSCAKARRELGYEPRPLRATLADAHAFWTRTRRAA